MNDRLSLCNPIPKLVTEEPSSSGRSVAGGNARSTTTTKNKNKELLLGLATNETQDHPPRRRHPKGRALPPLSWRPNTTSSSTHQHHLGANVRERRTALVSRRQGGEVQRDGDTRGYRAEKHGRPRVVPVLIKLSLVGGVIEHQFWVEFVFFSCCCCFSTKEVLLCWIQKMFG